MSALRHFALRVGVMDGGELSTLTTGCSFRLASSTRAAGLSMRSQQHSSHHCWAATLIVGKDGTASFRLRITVLSSLCRC